MFVVGETFYSLLLWTGSALCNTPRARGKLKGPYREQSSTLIKCQTGLPEKQPCSIMLGWQEGSQESRAKWCTSHWDTGRVSWRAVAKAKVVKESEGERSAVMQLMIRLESLLRSCICKAFHFPAGTSEASGKCRSAVEATCQESPDLHLPCFLSYSVLPLGHCRVWQPCGKVTRV